MGMQTLIREVESMLPVWGIGGGYQQAKLIVRLASMPPGETRRVYKVYGRGSETTVRTRPMMQEEAARMVAEARRRIALADAPD